MIIKKAVINGFGKYGSKEFNFDKGVNVIFGENEAGKSTLLWFIRGMLYGLKGGRAKITGEQAPLKKFQPWNGGPYSGTLEIQKNTGETYYITRDFDRKSLSIYDAHYIDITGKVLASGDMQPGEVFLGMNEACFENTCFIGPTGAGLSVTERKDVESKLLDVSETGFFDISLANAISLLEDMRKKEIGIVGDRRTGQDRPLNTTLRRIRELEEEIERYLQIKSDITRLQDQLAGIQKQIKEYEENIALLALEEEVLPLAASVSGDMAKIELLKNIASSWKENREKLEKVKLEEQRHLDVLFDLSSFAGETPESVKNPGKLVEKIRLYRIDYEKALLALKRYEAEKDDLEKRLKAYNAFEENKEAVDSVFDLVRILPVFEKDAKESVERLKKKQDTDLSDIAREIKKKKVLLYLVFALGLMVSAAVFALNPIFGILPAGLTALGVLLLSKAKRRLSIEYFKLKDNEPGNMETPETLRFESAKKQLIEMLQKFQCNTFDHFKRRLSEYKSMKSEMDAILLGRSMQNRTKDEKLELFTDAEEEFSQSVAKFRKDLSEKEEDVLTRIEQGWNRYNNTKIQLDQCNKRRKELMEAEATLILKMNEEGYSDFNTMDQALPVLKNHMQSRILNVRDKVKGIQNTDLNEVIAVLVKGDTGSVGGQLERLSQKNKQAREQNISGHRELIVKETEIQRDIDRLWAEYEGYKSAVEEMELQMEKKDQLMMQDRIVNETIQQLKLAGDDVKKNFYRPMSEKLNDYVNVITSGKHSDMKVGEQLQVNASMDSGIKNAMDYSTGTIEQIFLALRFAALELMEGNVKCPVFADEIFAAYDDRRVFNTLRLLAEFGKSRQILLFTCRMREPDMAKEALSEVSILRL